MPDHHRDCKSGQEIAETGQQSDGQGNLAEEERDCDRSDRKQHCDPPQNSDRIHIQTNGSEIRMAVPAGLVRSR